MSDLPTIVKLRYDLERWVNGRGGKIINKAVNVIDSSAEVVFEDATTRATFRIVTLRVVICASWPLSKNLP